MTARNLREPALLFVSSLFSVGDVFEEARAVLEKDFGEILYGSPALPWNYSDYYNEEIRPPLFKNFIFFRTLFDPGDLADVKLKTMEVEAAFSREGRRQINIDPGYLAVPKIVLASRKNYSHRVYLRKGIFAEVELFYKDGRFNPLFYTYSDYKDEASLDIFACARALLWEIISGAG